METESRRQADSKGMVGDCDALFLGYLAESLRRVGLLIAVSALLLTVSLNHLCVDVDALISDLYCSPFNRSKLGDQHEGGVLL